jgi:hypothetical protein
VRITKRLKFGHAMLRNSDSESWIESEHRKSWAMGGDLKRLNRGTGARNPGYDQENIIEHDIESNIDRKR